MGAGAIGVPQNNAAIDTIQVITTLITPAQMLVIDNTTAHAVVILPAPAANQVYEVLEYSINMQFPASGGVAYAAGGGGFAIGVDNAGSVLNLWGSPLSVAQIKGNQSQYCHSGSIENPTTNFSNVAGKALLLGLTLATQFTTGNSFFLLTVRYRVLTIA